MEMPTWSIELTGPVCVCFQETEAGNRRGEPDKRKERVGSCIGPCQLPKQLRKTLQPVKAPKQEKGKKASCSYTMNNHIREIIKRTWLAENDCNFHVTLMQTCNTGVTKKKSHVLSKFRLSWLSVKLFSSNFLKDYKLHEPVVLIYTKLRSKSCYYLDK